MLNLCARIVARREARMFPLTRPYRQALATLALGVITVLPTAFVAAWAWRINRPGHVRDVEVELGRQIGMQVTLDAVHYPQPGVVFYRGIVIRSEEPRGKALAEVLRAEQIRLQRVDHDLIVELAGPRLRSESARQAIARIGETFERSARIPFERINFTAPTCAFDVGPDEPRLAVKELAGEFAVDGMMPNVKLAFRMPGQGSGVETRCEMSLSRDRRSEPFATTLVFKTLEGPPLSARLLNVFFNADSWLGADAGVSGTLTLRQVGAKDWTIAFQGELIDVDLSHLVSQRFPRHRLAGRSRIEIAHAQWGERPAQGSGWVEIQGTLRAGPGTIGTTLVEALAAEMKFRPSTRIASLDPRKTELDFRSLGFSFEIRPNGEIQIAGALGEEFAPDVVLAGATAALLSAPRGAASVHGLIKTLFPTAASERATLVPLTAESQVLLALPVPAGPMSNAKAPLTGN
jgi:hypothetical protein